MKSIFKSEDSKKRLLEWHERFRKKIKQPLKSITVSTQFGQTHIWEGGGQNSPPLLLLHGAMASSAHVLSELTGLLEKFHVFAVDIIGQSVKSEDAKISVKNNDYGIWLSEVLEKLNLPNAHIAGVSWGGFTAIRLAAHAPEKINKLVLMVPAGIVNGPLLEGTVKLAFPMMMYQMSPSPARWEKISKNLLSTPDEDWNGYLSDAFLLYNMDMNIPRLAKVKEFSNFNAPVFVAGAEYDLSFPGKKLLSRAKRIFKSLQKKELIPGSKHSPPTTPEFRKHLSGVITDFLLEP